MIHEFTEDNILSIGKVLESTPKRLGNDVYRLEMDNQEDGRKLALEIHLGLEVDEKRMNMVSVYSGNTFLQLHNCTAFIASEMLKQVTFFGKQNGITSGLIIEQGAGCSLYSNVDDSVLTGDFTQLPEDMMMCGVALSLSDTLDIDDFSFDDDNVS
ncbi:hypothetical protein [Rhodohalobacter sulfatireducens]|uniref:Uncharacterized protein n=1 Tax=Rhodohalobacter sulfatireducens TaxID=2911366 RepID=A0ABS9KGV3_9BACT|nr:hypothetical protein [Rhodohalobacter sulfatireducens]MCG2590061.1 hypothetical protein [Rhodohalobacter sulfatireducens]